MEHGCVAKVGKEKYSRHVCMFYCLLCSLNGLFEGPTAGLGGGGAAGGHLDSNSITGCFLGGCAEVSGEVGFGLTSELWLPQRLKAAIEGGGAIRGFLEEDSPLGTPFIPAPGCMLAYILSGISLWLF